MAEWATPAHLGAGQTLALWERAEPLHPLGRAAALAGWSTGVAEVGAEPIGSVHARLLRLRRAQSGPQMAATADCPRCGARMEFELDADELLSRQDRAADLPIEMRTKMPADIAEWRAPTWADLDELEGDDAAATLLRRCISLADGRDPATLPPAVIEEIEAAMVAADPLAEILVASTCPGCDHRFDAAVDIVEFVWLELDARAKRLLHEVDILARAYGWTEPEILALSDQRRAAYLRLVLDGAP
jgi:hypothetical protein